MIKTAPAGTVPAMSPLSLVRERLQEIYTLLPSRRSVFLPREPCCSAYRIWVDAALWPYLAGLAVHLFGVVQHVPQEPSVVSVGHLVRMQDEGVERRQKAGFRSPPVDHLRAAAATTAAAEAVTGAGAGATRKCRWKSNKVDIVVALLWYKHQAWPLFVAQIPVSVRRREKQQL